MASDNDGSNLFGAVASGRLYTSSDSGATWTERQPAGDLDKFWRIVTSDADGSNLVAAVYVGRLYTSSDGGVIGLSVSQPVTLIKIGELPLLMTTAQPLW